MATVEPHPAGTTIKSLAAMPSMCRVRIVHRPDIYGRRWRDINRWRWRIIDGRWGCDIHRLRLNRFLHPLELKVKAWQLHRMLAVRMRFVFPPHVFEKNLLRMLKSNGIIFAVSVFQILYWWIVLFLLL